MFGDIFRFSEYMQFSLGKCYIFVRFMIALLHMDLMLVTRTICLSQDFDLIF